MRLFFEVMGRFHCRFVERAAELDLSPMQAKALAELEQPAAMGELAERLHCDASNITGIVDRLESRNLLKREPAPGDRRVKRLVLTDEGRQVRRAHQERLCADPPLFVGLTSADRRLLAGLLRRIGEGQATVASDV